MTQTSNRIHPLFAIAAASVTLVAAQAIHWQLLQVGAVRGGYIGNEVAKKNQ